MANNIIAAVAWGLMLGISSPASSAALPDFFDAALCQPPYDMAEADQLYKAAQAMGQADMSMGGIASFHLPQPIERDGFVARDIVFAGTAFGVMLDGEVAAQAARRYALSREEGDLLGTMSEGYARVLPKDQQRMKGMGLISLVARQGEDFPGKTLLMCEFVSDADRAAMKALMRKGR